MMTDNWDATIEPARAALMKRGDEMADYVQELQTKVFLQEKHIREVEAKLSNKVCPIRDICDLTVAYMAGAAELEAQNKQLRSELEKIKMMAARAFFEGMKSTARTTLAELKGDDRG